MRIDIRQNTPQVFPIGTQIIAENWQSSCSSTTGIVVAVREDRGEMLIKGDKPGYSNLYLIETRGAEPAVAHYINTVLAGEDAAISAFLSRPEVDEEHASDHSCYYCGMPATGWSNGERACTGCGA